MLSGEINIKTLKIKSLFNEVNDEEHIINEIEGNFYSSGWKKDSF